MNEALARWGRFGDYLSLTKPFTLLLHLPTVLASVVLATGALTFNAPVLAVILGGGLLAASANTFNCYFDRDLDATMERTKNRAIPAGRLPPRRALEFGIGLGLIGIAWLIVSMGTTVSVLSLLGFLSYVVIYTRWLKRKTFFSSIIGSLAGALPPVVAWVAVTGSLNATPFILGAIIMLWTPPHFWSLALRRKEDYVRSGVSAVPLTHVSTWVFSFLVFLGITCLALGWYAGLSGWFFLVSVPATLMFLYLALVSVRNPTDRGVSLFGYSILYLILIFVAMIIGKIY